MTPLLIPGAEGDLPIMTWGEVGATPLRVAEPFDAAEEAALQRAEQGAGFHIKGPSHRERVANALEAQTRKKGSSRGKRKAQQQHPTPLQQSVGSRRDVRSLTPAAQTLAAKLAGALGQQAGQGLGGGAGSQLRASYGGASSSGKGAAAAAASARAASSARAARGVAAATPEPSPMRVAPVRRARGEGDGGGGGGGNRAKAGVTENLLNI